MPRAGRRRCGVDAGAERRAPSHCRRDDHCACAGVVNGSEGRPNQPSTADARLFIQPGHEFRIGDGLITNFHLPRSSLFVLVAAFAGRERVLRAYREAVAQGYRFYSYGDAMAIL